MVDEYGRGYYDGEEQRSMKREGTREDYIFYYYSEFQTECFATCISFLERVVSPIVRTDWLISALSSL